MNEIPQLWPEALKNNLSLGGDSPWINNVNTKRQPFIEVFLHEETMNNFSEHPNAVTTQCERLCVTFVSKTD